MCSRRETSSATKNPQDVTIALNCQPATCTNNEKKKRKEKSSVFWEDTLKSSHHAVSNHLLFAPEPTAPSFLVPELSFSFHICCLQIFLSPPPFLNARIWIASPFLQASITSDHGEHQTPLLPWSLPSCPWPWPYQVQCVISHLLAIHGRVRWGPVPPQSEPWRFKCIRNMRSHI